MGLGVAAGLPPFVEPVVERWRDGGVLPCEVWGSRARTTGARRPAGAPSKFIRVRVRRAAICREALPRALVSAPMEGREGSRGLDI